MSSMDEITWDNIESHTKEQIQNENVKNGLARCDNELKKKSVTKWRNNYLKIHNINLSEEAKKKIQSLENEIKTLKERNQMLEEKFTILKTLANI